MNVDKLSDLLLKADMRKCFVTGRRACLGSSFDHHCIYMVNKSHISIDPLLNK